MSEMGDAIRALRATGDGSAFCAAVPYLRHMRIALRVVDGRVQGSMPFHEDLIGNHTLPALHGGAVGALLEATATGEVLRGSDELSLPRVVDLTVDYLRMGKAIETFARATITREGRRVLSIRAEAWQDEPDRPIATLQAHFLLRPLPAETS
jgi:acyl-coenzyme A thioesterase PaaI-like protein